MMKKKYLLKTKYQAAKSSRLLAKSIDLFLFLILSVLHYPGGLILGIIYLAISDGLQSGQSVGKKVVGFAVVSLVDGKPCQFKQSFIRNLPFTLPFTFFLIPFWGWIIGLVLSILLISFELYLLIKLDSGHRLGDVMADTTVIANDQFRLDIRKRQTSWFETEDAQLS